MIIPKQQVDVLIKNGQTAGLTGKEVLDGLIQRGYQPEGIDINAINNVTKKEGYGQRVMKDISSGIQQATQDINSVDNRSSLSKGISAVSNVASAVASPITELPVVKQIGEVIAKAVNAGGEALSNLYTPEFQKELANLSPEDFKVATQPLQDILNTGNIANTILAAKGVKSGVETIPKITSSVSEKTIGSVKNLQSIIKSAPDIYPTDLVNTITDKITTLDPQTKNILKTATIEKFNHYVKAGEIAKSDPRALTPLEMAGEKVNNQILPTIKEDLNNIGSQKAKSLDSVKNVQVPNASLDTIQFVKDSIKNSKLTSEESKLVNATIDELQLGKSPTLGTLDKTVDLLQNTLYEKSKGLAIPVTSRVEGIINQAIGKLNNKVKDAASKALGSNEYSVLNDAYATKIDLFNKLNKAIGEDAAKGGSLFKRFFSPQDSGTKKLFAEIKSQYGIDLAEDATLAKFVMDSLGDTRSRSMLEQIPMSKTGIVTKGLQTVERKLTNPIGKAQRIIEKRAQVK